MNERPIALSAKVLAELRADRTLYAVYLARFGRYDDEIEPLHQKGWVRQMQEIEETERLPKAQAIAADADATFPPAE